MRILVLGATGMLGHKVFQLLQQRYADTLATIQGSLASAAISEIDLFNRVNTIEQVRADDFSALRLLLSSRQPDVVVNCVGIIKQRVDAKAAIPSITLNALLPHTLAEICGPWGGRVIHFSTDCVFSGAKGNYREEDFSDARDLYGQTKFLGEVSTSNAITLRTSMIGRELFNFGSLLEWFLRHDRGKVHGYTRAFYSGVTTNYLAGVVADIIEKHPHLSGLYQVCGTTVSKFDLLCLIRDAFNLQVEIVPQADFFCDRSMVGEKFRHATGHQPPPWPDLIRQLASDPTPYARWRGSTS